MPGSLPFVKAEMQRLYEKYLGSDLVQRRRLGDNNLDDDESLAKAGASTMNEDTRQKDIVDIQESLEIQAIPGRTYLCVVVLDSPKEGQRRMHKVRHVRCYHGSAFTQGYPYDQNSDSYLINCVEALHIGHISLAFQVAVPDTEWKVTIPVPPSVVDRHLSDSQKAELKMIRDRYKDDRFQLKMVQMSGCEC